MVYSEEEFQNRKYNTTEKKTCFVSSFNEAIGSDQDINIIVPDYPDRERVGPHTPEGDELENLEDRNYTSKKKSKATLKRRNRRNKLKSHRSTDNNSSVHSNDLNCLQICETPGQNLLLDHTVQKRDEKDSQVNNKEEEKEKMSDNKSRDDIIAARQAKKHAKQKVRSKDSAEKKDELVDVKNQAAEVTNKDVEETKEEIEKVTKAKGAVTSPKGEDEVDKVCLKVESVSIEGDKDKEQIKAERAAKKAAKQAKKKDAGKGETPKADKPISKVSDNRESKPVNEDMTVKDVVETLRDIVTVAKDIKAVTEKVSAIDLSGKKSQTEESNKGKPEESGKSKAELRAERRAKQEAQRALKQANQEQKEVAQPKVETKTTVKAKDVPSKEEKAVKAKSAEKSKAKSMNSHRVNWFQHLYKEHDKQPLKSIAINSHLHPAIIKLGVQLATRVVTGSNARCVALLDALKKMVRDYMLPAKTEFGRGLEAHLAASVEFLWAQRAPSASQSNAVKFFRYHLTQLPNNVNEFDAKKTLQEEIDRYIREQIDMAGEAISIAVRNKISDGDNILTYGRSSLIERILREAWSCGVRFRVVVVGSRVQSGAQGLLRTLVAHGLPCTYVDITALSCVMNTINKVIVGAGALLGNGSVLGAIGTAQVALAARAHNVPTLVACETHKFSPRVQTDAFVYNEIGDPDDLIDKSDNNSPLKDWRSNPNLTPLNLTYDVTPASLVTAVVTELAILPCTSAPVVLRFKLSEYGV